MSKAENILIKNAQIVNEFNTFFGDLYIKNERIEKIGNQISVTEACTEIDASNKILIPGVIDDQVHFREPGLTHKADIGTESFAALFGGVTSFMEMPNVVPQTTTIEKLEQKFEIGREKSHVNYSFFLGGTNDNYEELMKINIQNTCGIKLFMGSSTGDMLVDNEAVLEKIFANSPTLIATHCESETRIKERTALAIEQYGEDIPANQHPVIRDAQACLLSSTLASNLAKKHNTRLHILHISTEIETHLFENNIPLIDKKITAEACVHHLHFCDVDYEKLGNLIKCNPAIKSASDREGIWAALLDNRIDIIATDHAPHTWDEKQNKYLKSPSGLPLVQHSLQLMLHYVNEGKLSLEQMVNKMCHAPSDCFRIQDRGYIREGYFADLVLVDTNKNYLVEKENLKYKCAWSPLEGTTFNTSISDVFVNGTHSIKNGLFTGNLNSKRLYFNR